MSATNRSQLINKLFKVARKQFTPVSPISSRSVLDHMLYACCLENSRYIAADEAFARLEENFFDWNEVRVTTTKELSESMKGLANAEAAALSLKKTLHGVFETYYKFDIEFLKKENLRKTVQQFNKFRGVSPFVVSYTAQVALGGHFIPVDTAQMNLMVVLGIVSESEAEKGRVPGLERTISKNKGVEFASVVHQLAAEFHKSPQNKDIRAVICTISPDAKDRFPKRGVKKKKEPVAVEAAAPAKKAKKPAAKPAKKAAVKKVAKKKPVKKKVATRKTSTKKSKAAAKKKTVSRKKTARKATRKKSSTKKTVRPKKKSATRSLSRKKPR
jgi:hypothetical protein